MIQLKPQMITLIKIGAFTLFRNKADYDAYFDELMGEGARAEWGDPMDPPAAFPFIGRQVMDEISGWPVEFMVLTQLELLKALAQFATLEKV